MNTIQNRGQLISVHIADLHFAAFNPQEQYKILHEQFVNKIQNFPRIDIISVDGDIFDHKLMGNSNGIYYASMIIDELVNIAREKNATLLLLHGTYSHDADQLKLFYHYTEDKTVDVRIINTIRFEIIKNARILCIPELYGVPEEVYQDIFHHEGWYDECFLHGTFEGAVYGDTVNANGRLFHLQDFNMCTGLMLAGHVHKPGCFQKYFYYCGTPYRYKFGEEEDKGFLIVMHDLDTNYFDVHFETITSSTYVTIELDDIISSDPNQVIKYIDNLKQDRGIDYLKIKFKKPVENSNKVIINSYYRNSRTTFVEFMNVLEEQKAKAESSGMIDGDLAFLLDDKMDGMEKFVRYVNIQEGCEYITVDKLKSILQEQI